MSTVDKDRFHRAARDGFIDLIKEATRKDSNAPDEDGMTPTIWAAYYGHLDALRTLVGRGGDPDKCDLTGNTGLHWSAYNGHINCVSFLINFGVNLWALNNDFHTAKDLAALEGRTEILNLMDQVLAKQSALNPKMVMKLKEKSVQDAEKRVKNFDKLHKKATRKAEKEDKYLQKQRKKLLEPLNTLVSSAIRRESITSSSASANNLTLKFSDIVNNGTMTSTKVKGLAGVSRKVHLKKQMSDSVSVTNSCGNGNDFKVRDSTSNGFSSKSSVRSLTGLRRDNQVLYVRKYNQVSNQNTVGDSGCERQQQQPQQQQQKKRSKKCGDEQENEFIRHQKSGDSENSTHETADNNYRPRLKDLFKSGFDDSLANKKLNLFRTYSEPDFMSHFGESGIKDDPVTPPESSIFERPGFGSVAFRKPPLYSTNLLPMGVAKKKKQSTQLSQRSIESDNGSSHSGPSLVVDKKEKMVLPEIVKFKATESGGSDSIGSAGSLAQRNASLSVMSDPRIWDDEDVDPLEDLDEDSKVMPSLVTPPIVLFLAANSATEYLSLFQKEKIDLEALMLLNEDDLKGLGLPLGPRRKLMRAIEKRKSVQEDPGCIRDTPL